MKKTQMFYYILVFFLVFTSCQKDEQAIPANNQTQVTRTLTQEQMRQIASELKLKSESKQIPPVGKESSRLKSSASAEGWYSQSNYNFYFTCHIWTTWGIGVMDGDDPIDAVFMAWYRNVYNPTTGGVDSKLLEVKNIPKKPAGYYEINGNDKYFNSTYYTSSDTWLYFDVYIIEVSRSRGPLVLDRQWMGWFYLQPYMLI